MSAFMIVALVFFGLALGSFAGATVWRLRARQLVEDEKLGAKLTKLEKAELKRLRPLAKVSLKKDRSQCLNCNHTLAWYDLIPLLSWLSTGGKCRYCRRPIGWFEPAIELGTAGALVLLLVMWQAVSPSENLALFGLWSIAFVLMAILFAYDAKWFLVPSIVVYPLIATSAVVAVVRALGSDDVVASLLGAVGAVAVLAGIYLALYAYSYWRFGYEGTWVGFGDVEIGLALGLLLGSWQLAFLALFLANFFGLVVILPSLVAKKRSMKARVPFGPLLIAGFFVALFWGSSIIDWYMGLSSYIV